MPFVSSVTATALIADTAPDLVSGEPAGFEASEESVRIPSYNGGNGHFSYMFIVHENNPSMFINPISSLSGSILYIAICSLSSHLFTNDGYRNPHAGSPAS